MEKIAVYDNHAGEYDQWFDKHPVWFQSELKALGKVMPRDMDKRGSKSDLTRSVPALWIRSITECPGSEYRQ